LNFTSKNWQNAFFLLSNKKSAFFLLPFYEEDKYNFLSKYQKKMILSLLKWDWFSEAVFFLTCPLQLDSLNKKNQILFVCWKMDLDKTLFSAKEIVQPNLL